MEHSLWLCNVEYILHVQLLLHQMESNGTIHLQKSIPEAGLLLFLCLSLCAKKRCWDASVEPEDQLPLLERKKRYRVLYILFYKYMKLIFLIYYENITNVCSSHTSGNPPLSHYFCSIQFPSLYFLAFSYNSKLTSDLKYLYIFNWEKCSRYYIYKQEYYNNTHLPISSSS